MSNDAATGATSRMVMDIETTLGTPKTSSKLGRKMPFVNGGAGIIQKFDQPVNMSVGGDVNPRKPGRGKGPANGKYPFYPNVVMMPFLTKIFTGNLASLVNGWTTITAGIDDTVTSVPVDTEGVYPTAPFDVVIGTEQITVSNKGTGGVAWTVTRGVNGTSAAAHSSGADVVLVTDLNGAILIGATTLTVDSSSGFPASGSFVVSIGTEHLLVIAVSGLNWTVTRGYGGTTAAGHADEAIVKLVSVTGTHTSILANGPLSFCVEEVIKLGSVEYFWFGTGFRFDVLTWPFEVGNFRTVTATMEGEHITKPDGDTPGTAYDTTGSGYSLDWLDGDGSAAYTPMDDDMVLTSGGFQVDGGDVLYVEKGSVTGNAQLNKEGYTINSVGERNRITPKRHTVDLSLDLVFTDPALLKLLKNQRIGHSVRLIYTVQAGPPEFSFEHYFPLIAIQETGIEIQGDDEIKLQGMTAKAYKDVTLGTAWQMITKNDQRKAAYA